jgi:hypothetical protein
MAISTYAELKTAIAAWAVRTDLTSRLGDFVTLAEGEIRRDVRCTAMETLASGTLTGETLAMPTGFIWANRLKVGDYVQKYVTPAVYADLDEADETAARFTIIGQSLYILNGASGDSYSLIYLKSFTAFSADADTNWLLTNHPGVYLWAGCKQLAIAIRDRNEEQLCDGRYRAAVAAVNRNEWMAGASGSTLAVRPSAMVV